LDDADEGYCFLLLLLLYRRGSSSKLFQEEKYYYYLSYSLLTRKLVLSEEFDLGANK